MFKLNFASKEDALKALNILAYSLGFKVHYGFNDRIDRDVILGSDEGELMDCADSNCGPLRMDDNPIFYFNEGTDI